MDVVMAIASILKYKLTERIWQYNSLVQLLPTGGRKGEDEKGNMGQALKDYLHQGMLMFIWMRYEIYIYF